MKDLITTPSRELSLMSRTLWRIETELGASLTLNALADVEGVSPFHLTRVFSLCLGQAPMTYVKARRLSEAAKQLRKTKIQIVEIAFDAGYDSHEGFSRAFRDHFGYTPSAVRADPNLPLTLQEALRMPDTALKNVTPRLVARQEQRIVGMTRRVTFSTLEVIPQHWDATVAEIGHAMYGVPTFGACFDFDGEGFTYLVGIADDGRIDTERLEHLTLPARDYAVFDHDGHIASLNETWEAILEGWLPSADYVATREPEFELYEPDFDPKTAGGVSIWIPVTPKG